jgi:hypothetical protein
MSATPEAVQLVAGSGAIIMTIIAGVRSWIAAKRNRNIVTIHVDDKEWTIDRSKISREELQIIIDEITNKIGS